MKYTISRLCGHTETVNLYGSRQSREASIQWLKQTLCKKCFRETQTAELDEYTPVRMSYREFKLNYSDYKTESESYDPADKTIIVYIPQDIDPDQEMDKRRGKLIRDLMALNISEGEAIQYAEIGAYQLHDIVEEEENKRKTRKPANKKSSPKRDLSKENYVSSRQAKRATQKNHHRVLA